MKLLLDERRLIIAIGSSIEFGVWGNLRDMWSWKITETQYVMDNNFTVVDIGDKEIPTYVRTNEYYYINDEFTLADECPNEYRDKISQNKMSITELEDCILAMSEILFA